MDSGDSLLLVCPCRKEQNLQKDLILYVINHPTKIRLYCAQNGFFGTTNACPTCLHVAMTNPHRIVTVSTQKGAKKTLFSCSNFWPVVPVVKFARILLLKYSHPITLCTCPIPLQTAPESLGAFPKVWGLSPLTSSYAYVVLQHPSHGVFEGGVFYQNFVITFSPMIRATICHLPVSISQDSRSKHLKLYR